MKVKEFNRSNVREISDRIQSSLSELSKELGIELNVNGGRFDAGKFTLKLEGILLTDSGAVVAPEYKHSYVDEALKAAGVALVGNAIGSMWQIRGEIYTVMDYITKRPKYPFQLKRTDGRMSKCAAGFIKQGTQLAKPTEKEFQTWFTVDPDSDAVLESDVVICDRVADYLSNTLPEGDGDDFFDYVDKMNEKFSGKKLLAYAKEIYGTLYGNSSTSLKDANIRMKCLIKKGGK